MADSRIGSTNSSASFYQQTQAGSSSHAANNTQSESHSRVSSWLSQNSLRPMSGRAWAEQYAQSEGGSRRVPQASAQYESATVLGLSELSPSSLSRSDTRGTTAVQLGSRRFSRLGGVRIDEQNNATRYFGGSMRSEAESSYSELKQQERINKAAEQMLSMRGDSVYGPGMQSRISEGKLPKLIQQQHKIPESDVSSVIQTYHEMASEQKSKSSNRSSWWRR